MKTQNVNNKLKFDKNSLAELNQKQIQTVIGGNGQSKTIGITIQFLKDLYERL